MKPLLGFLVLFLLGCANDRGSSIATQSIRLSPDTIKFNSLSYQDTLLTSVHCNNRSGENIKILRIENACGCTSGVLSDSTIYANDSVLIAIKYIPKISDDKGEVTKYLSIRTNSKQEPFVNIVLKGVVVN